MPERRLSDALKPARGDISLAPRLHKTSVDVLAARHNTHLQTFNLGQQYRKVRLRESAFNHGTLMDVQTFAFIFCICGCS